jgi:hypothetical protein
VEEEGRGEGEREGGREGRKGTKLNLTNGQNDILTQ